MSFEYAKSKVTSSVSFWAARMQMNLANLDTLRSSVFHSLLSKELAVAYNEDSYYKNVIYCGKIHYRTYK